MWQRTNIFFGSTPSLPSVENIHKIIGLSHVEDCCKPKGDRERTASVSMSGFPKALSF